MGDQGRDTRKIEAVARRYKMDEPTRREFGDKIEGLKARGEFGSGPNGDFTWAELCQIAEDVLEGDL